LSLFFFKKFTMYNAISSPRFPIKAWTGDMDIEEQAVKQLRNTATLPFIHSHLAVMPDVHFGLGATIGSVVPTVGAVVPACVGVDIGCGMCAVKTDLKATDLPDNLKEVRTTIEKAVPHGRTANGGRNDRGAWRDIPKRVGNLWKSHLDGRFQQLTDGYKNLERSNHVKHLGTLGGGNHFVEVCLDENDQVWFMLHSGSRGVGNAIAQIFIAKARKEMERQDIRLPDRDLAYLVEGSESFDDYVFGVEWAQDFARINRQVMMENMIEGLRKSKLLKQFKADVMAVNCHHNYVTRERHYGKECFITRKGAVRAGLGDLGIIPGSMGTRSYIVRGKGNQESFHSCSHGAGRVMSRTQAKKRFSLDDHAEATAHVECRKDKDVIDETPMAYKDIDKVMEAQSDLVDIVHTLRQVVCVKG
jgi:tRNA-splicing ligase RtcB